MHSIEIAGVSIAVTAINHFNEVSVSCVSNLGVVAAGLVEKITQSLLVSRHARGSRKRIPDPFES